MPSMVGAFKIVGVGASTVVHIGDSVFQSPTSADKTLAGSGAFNTGDVLMTNNAVNGTNTNDPDVVDASATRTTV